MMNQCRDLRTCEIWVNRGVLDTARAAELRISLTKNDQVENEGGSERKSCTSPR